MSINQFPGGIIRGTPVVPAGPLASGAAPGVWTLDEATNYIKQGIWPIAGNNLYIEDMFSTYLYTGNGSTQTITNGIDLSTYGGLVWTKVRSTTYSHFLADTVRGAVSLLSTNNTSAADTGGNLYSGFNSNGYGVTTSYGSGTNGNGQTFSSWTFRKQAKFFDVVTYTGTGANRTIAHNLGSVPGCIMIKRTDTTGAWAVYHRSLANTQYMVLNTTAAAATGATYWNSTTPTSSVFSLGTATDVNASGGTYVAYLFAHDAGGFGATGTDNVISCGSFTTDGSTTPSITLGYEPQWVLIKNAGGAGAWILVDNMRGIPVGSADPYLVPSSSDAESTSNDWVSPNATGFTAPWFAAAAASTFIYIAIRRGPMKTPTSGTSVFTPVVHTGTGSTTTVSGFNFPSDFVIARRRDLAGADFLAQSRLQGGGARLKTNDIDGETIDTGSAITGFDSMTGLIVSGNAPLNTSGQSIIFEAFRRAPGFFDVVCYTGTGTSGQTYSHNLGVAPELMFVKRRDNIDSWYVYSATLGNTKRLRLNANSASVTDSAAWNNTTPTSTQFTVGNNSEVNAASSTYVAYLFATVAGVSKVGSYTGTGTTKQIDCGFTGGARFVLIKRTDSTGDWYVWDSARGIVAGNDPYLLLNSTAAEVTGTDYVDTYAAGFEISSTAPAAINANGGSFIFLAIA